jgi:excisionase family DNA binding protein
MLPCRMQTKQSAAYRSVANSAAEPPPARPGKPFTKRELSRFLGISERFIELEVNRGRLRAVRLSNRLLRFRPSDVEQWMESSLTAVGESIRDEY